MKSLTSMVLSLSLAAGITGCKRDYSFLEQRDAAGDISQRYDLGADHRVAADIGGDRERKYDLGNDVAPVDWGLDAVVRDVGRDALEADGRRADSAVVDGILPDRYADLLRPDRYTADAPADSLQRYDATRRDAAPIDAPPGDTYSPDAGVMDAARADRPIIIFPDMGIPDLYADGRTDMLPDIGADLPADLGTDLPPDLGADVGTNPCPGEAPLNSLQAGVCAGSRNSCGPTGWQEDYSSVVGYEVNEVTCDGLDNDCLGGVDDNLIPPSQECFDGVGECRRSGLEYKTCLGIDGWSVNYGGCDAVAGEPQAELCDEADRDCNGIVGRVDLTEIIDDFNRPDQAGLGNNVVGNPWEQVPGSNQWNILNNAAYINWRALGNTPVASSYIGHRATFNILSEFKLARDTTNGFGGGGVFRLGINCSPGLLDGFLVRVGQNSPRQHALVREGVDIDSGDYELRAETTYNLRLWYDGTTLHARIWERDAPEPAEELLTAVVANIAADKENLSIGSDLDTAEENVVTIDNVVDECE